MSERPAARPRRPRGRILGVCLAAILVAVQILPCGPDFPNMLLNQGDHAILAAPTVRFKHEIERMRLAESRYRHKPSFGDFAQEAAEAELADLAEALRRAGKEKRDIAEITANHAVERRKLPGALSNARVVDGLPGEFEDYFRGSIEWHRAEEELMGEEARARAYRRAREAWEAVLKLPAEERRFKSTWAAFMLGKLEAWSPGGDPDKGIAYFRQVRALADAGFEDSVGLAAASLGMEALIHFQRGNLVRALELYLEQAAAGDPSAVESLRIVAGQAIQSDQASLRELAAHPAARQVVTAYFVSRRLPWAGEERDESGLMRWLELLEGENVRDVGSAEKLALAAYQAGKMELARRWVDRAPKESAVARWLRAKLLLYEGRVDNAAAVLAELCREFPVNPEPDRRQVNSFARGLTVEGVKAAEHALGELGVLRLAQREFTEALDALLRSGFWMDAAYVAERVLTLRELKAYVDMHWPEPSGGVDQGIELPRFWERATAREVLAVQIRYLLARRLARAGEHKSAREYYPASWRLRFDEFRDLLAAARDPDRPARERARLLFESAVIMRRNGLELVGTEVAPDWRIYDGNYQTGVTGEGREARTDGHHLSASREELTREAAHRPKPDRRFHYRYLAAELGFEAAQLLPDNDEETARILCISGTWLKNRDPEAADRFYKALVRRCPKTELGKEADRLRWFPRIDEEGNILPQLPPPPEVPAAEPAEAATPLPIT